MREGQNMQAAVHKTYLPAGTHAAERVATQPMSGSDAPKPVDLDL